MKTKNFRKKLIDARKKCGLTQKQIAEKTGTTEVGYLRYEHGERLPNVLTAISIGEAVGVHSVKELKELWGGNLTTT